MYNEVEKDEQQILQSNNLYSKLSYIAKVYDEPQGLSLSHILELLGQHATSENEVRELLDKVKWATKVGDDVYSFAQNVIPYMDKKTTEVDFDKEKYISVLKFRYNSGMQFDSIDFENFRAVYLEMWNEKINFNDEELEKKLRCCGVFYHERLFPEEGIIDIGTKEKLFSYIENNFAQGKKILYYKAIFTELSDEFVYCFSLTDEYMLKEYIQFVAEKGKYYFFDEYMSVEKDVEVNHAKEITEYMLSAGKPLSYEEIYEGLSHVPRKIISREIQRNKMFICDAKGCYFHQDIFEISDNEMENIIVIIKTEIEDKGYAIWADIYRMIEEQIPVFIENNLYLSSLGIRNMLAHLLQTKFNFESAIICDVGKRLTMSDIYRLYAEHHPKFTSEDIYCFSKEVDTVIYFSAIYEKSVRVGKDLFVSKDTLKIDIDAVDKAIDTYLSRDFIPLKEIDSFLLFPYVGYEWNDFLLESYLVSYSKKFKLVNNGFSLKNAAGAVLKKESSIDNFEDVCAIVLAESEIELKKDNALEYLSKNNFITRKSYKNLDSALSKAIRMRNRKD